MFDIGFSEIVVIAVVALIVIGPERLPKTARMLGHLFGRLQRYVNEVKSDISREMELDELRRLQREVKGAASEFEQSVKSVASDFHSSVRNVEQQLNQAGMQNQPNQADMRNSTTQQGAANSLSPPSTPSPPDAPSPPEEPSRQPTLPGFDKL
jgi:sec-independent protein translocase protein TatB